MRIERLIDTEKLSRYIDIDVLYKQYRELKKKQFEMDGDISIPKSIRNFLDFQIIAIEQYFVERDIENGCGPWN